jgi:hypothetical protein
MLIGKKESIAIEYELDKNYGGVWMYGRICFWINNIRVGDYDLGTSLRDVLFQMKYLIADNGNRDGLILCEMPYEEVFYQLNESIYGDPLYIISKILDTPARYDIRIPVDVFELWKIYLIDCNDFSIILFKNETEEYVHSAYIERGEFDSIVNQLYCDLDCFYESAASN